MMMTMTMMFLMARICTIRKATRPTTLHTPKSERPLLLPTTLLYLLIHHGCGFCLLFSPLLVPRPTCFSPYDTLASALLLLLRCCLFTLWVCSGTRSSNDPMTLKKLSLTAAESASLYHLTHPGPDDFDFILPKAAGTRKSIAASMSAATCLLDSHLLQTSVRHALNDI